MLAEYANLVIKGLKIKSNGAKKINFRKNPRKMGKNPEKSGKKSEKKIAQKWPKNTKFHC